MPEDRPKNNIISFPAQPLSANNKEAQSIEVPNAISSNICLAVDGEMVSENDIECAAKVHKMFEDINGPGQGIKTVLWSLKTRGNLVVASEIDPSPVAVRVNSSEDANSPVMRIDRGEGTYVAYTFSEVLKEKALPDAQQAASSLIALRPDIPSTNELNDEEKREVKSVLRLRVTPRARLIEQGVLSLEDEAA